MDDHVKPKEHGIFRELPWRYMLLLTWGCWSFHQLRDERRQNATEPSHHWATGQRCRAQRCRVQFCCYYVQQIKVGRNSPLPTRFLSNSIWRHTKYVTICFAMKGWKCDLLVGLEWGVEDLRIKWSNQSCSIFAPKKYSHLCVENCWNLKRQPPRHPDVNIWFWYTAFFYILCCCF